MASEEAAPQALNYIPEVVLKKRKNNEQWLIRKKLQQLEKAKRQKSGNYIIKKPEQFIREYRDKVIDGLRHQEMDFIQMKSRGKRSKLAPVTPESKLLFVIRIRGKNDMCPNTRKILYALRLRKIFNGVFVKANAGLMELLQKVEPYVTYGYPSVKSVKDLIYKKGVVRVGKERIPLTDNNVVEQELGQHNILCIEDIANEIVNVGTHFKTVTNFLCPFKLNNPDKALLGKKKRFDNGGDSGNRKDKINEFLSKMN